MTTSRIPRILCWMMLSAVILAGTGLSAQDPSTEASPVEYPKLEKPLNLLLPRDVWHLVHSWDSALIKMRIGQDGELIDWIPLHLPHHRVTASIGKALEEARFTPAMENGEPLAVDIVAEIPLREAVRFSVISQSVTEHLESRMATLAPQLNELIVHTPEELDAPLEVVSTGEIYKVKDESGNILTGTVTVEFYVDQTGSPRMIRTIDAADSNLAQAAVRTAENFRFAPPRAKGKPAVTKARMPIIAKD